MNGDSMSETSPPFVLKKSNDLPENNSFPIGVREFRAPISTDGSLGTPELIVEETLIVNLHEWGYFAEAISSRTKFQLADRPDENRSQ